ncbi:MAG: hypothetical protein O3A93_04125 [Chloroflexi bacterium]|nr:hypothetical protein [Chloroflexota bacterium]MDA1270432.1 hypothetical protein [Chloroflexota bacterium]
MPLNHLRAVAQHHQSRDGAETSRFEIDGGAVVDLAVDDLVNQAHHFGRKLSHGRRRHRVVVRAVVALPEIDGSLVQVFGVFFQTALFQIFFLQVVFRTHDISRI